MLEIKIWCPTYREILFHLLIKKIQNNDQIEIFHAIKQTF